MEQRTKRYCVMSIIKGKERYVDSFDLMDQVICIQNGTCVCGSHASLLEENAEYRTLVQLQCERTEV